MQKAERLSFQTVLGLEGRRKSLVNKISIGAQSLRSWFLRSFNVIWKLDTFFKITNCQTIPMFFSTERKTIYQRDELWFVGFLSWCHVICWATIEHFHAFAKCSVHRCLHNVGTLNSLLAKSCYSGEKNSVLLAKHKDTKIPTMMKPFSLSAAWFWWTSVPHPREPTRKGLDKAVVEGFNIKL